MARLVEKLPLPEKRKEMVDACVVLLDAEVKKKGGISGLAVKAAYKMLKAFKPGAVPEAVDGLFDDFIGELESFHQEFEKASGPGTFGAYMKPRAPQIGEALVGVTDRRADRSKHKTLVKAYRKLRPSAVRNVQEAVPGLADLIDRYYG
jgi:hypothetical protein